jgi:hypothetical protein
MGLRHSCASYPDGHVACWGDASRGQLGPGVPRAAFQQATVRGLPPVVEVAAAALYSCARTRGGEVWCWGGDNEQGQLGTAEPGPAPRLVPGVQGAVGLSLFGERACARLPGEQFVCWGDSGACADASSDQGPAPVLRLESLDATSALQLARAAGSCFWCVLHVSRQLECSTPPESGAPVTLAGVTAVAAGDTHACAALLDGSVQCWGSNVRGELGRATAGDRDAQPASVEW